MARKKTPASKSPAKKTKSPRAAASASKAKKQAAPARKGRKSQAKKKGAAKTKQAPSSKEAERKVPIAGIGASAGGLEAFQQLLEPLSAETGMAFVLLSHLSHTRKSMLSELLARATPMPVSQVGRRTRVEANHVYVIPPNTALTVSDGYLETKPLERTGRPTMVIDSFLRSLAENRKSQAIGVILSGTGTDGTLGIAAIKAEGGITFAQDENTARYSDMPRSANAQPGAVDFVLPPGKIAEELARIARHPYLTHPKAVPPLVVEREEDALGKIFSLVRSTMGVDFARYKPGTITRRISRRMVLHKIDSLGSYLKKLQFDSRELEALYNDLLINVTGFFRDAATFEILQKRVIPKVLKQRRRQDPVRVWVPGCATGEEAYSLAICLLEAMGDFRPSPPLQVFATDVSGPIIQRAREGLYTKNIVGDLSPERLRRFFVEAEGGYQISKQVRDLCVFAVQNVIKDPPFSRMDLISCRNLLIYLDAVLQKRVLATFHYALKPSGFLVLGSSETVGPSSEFFRQIDSKQRVYSKLQTTARPDFDFGPREAELHDWPPPTREARGRDGLDIGKEADKLVLSKYAPPGVVVNPAMEIVQFRGRTGPFLEPSPGEASLNILKMAREGLLVDLRAALHQAKKTSETARKHGLRVRSNGGLRTIDLEVVPLPAGERQETHYLVLFQEAASLPQEAPSEAGKPLRKKKDSKAHRDEVETLRRELATTQEDLHSIIEEQEATNEELQSANEEILSSNEELQSTNEELETAKEELQATNEELTTVNEELHNRNAELAKANSDLNNLISSVDFVYVMLGDDLRIRRFTPAAQKVLNLIPGDIGRPIGDINPNIDVPDLEKQIAEAIDRVTTKHQEAQDAEGRWYSMRIQPYKTADNRIEGAVMALLDIDELKRLQQALRSLVERTPDFIMSAEPPGKVLFINRTITSLAKKAVIGENIYDYLEPRDHDTVRACLEKVCATAEAAEFRSRGLSGRNSTMPCLTRVEAIKTEGKIVALTMTTHEAPKQRRTPNTRNRNRAQP